MYTLLSAAQNIILTSKGVNYTNSTENRKFAERIVCEKLYLYEK